MTEQKEKLINGNIQVERSRCVAGRLLAICLNSRRRSCYSDVGP